MKDSYSDIGLAQALAPAVVSATATSSEIDLQGFNSATVLVNTGAIVGSGDFTVSLEESDTTTGGDFTAVAAGDLIGEFPASLAAASTYKVGYRGTKRYIRTVTTNNSGTSIGAGIVVMLGHPNDAPVA